MLSKYELIWGLIILFGICEIVKFILGIIIAKKLDEVNGAKWYGKLNTVVIYATMMLLILFPELSTAVANLLLIVCGAVMIFAHVLYFRLYYKILRNGKANRN